jgi:hypothetical protein
MTSAMALNKTSHNESLWNELRTRGWGRNTLGAIFGLVGGIVTPLVGSILTAMSWLTGSTWHGFAIHRIGTVLLFMTIPLLLFGAHCLDLSDKERELADQRERSDR